jgi:hypothetical protein
MHKAWQLRMYQCSIHVTPFSSSAGSEIDVNGAAAVDTMELVLSRLIISTAILLISSYIFVPRVARWLSRRALVRKHQCKEPPQLPLDLAEINQKAAKEHRFLETTTRLFNEYGKTYKARRAGRTIIRTCDPEVFKAVLSTHFENFGMQPIRYEDGKGFFGNGMLVTDGAQWKHSRALIRPVFDIAHVVNFGRLSTHVERFMQLIPRDGATIDIFPVLKRLVWNGRLNCDTRF